MPDAIPDRCKRAIRTQPRARHAFALFDPAGESAMMFTEHCGYHVVDAGGVRVLREVPRPAAGP